MAERPLPERLIARRRTDPATGCWVWAGAWDRDRYGVIRVAGKLRKVHHAAAAAWLDRPLGDARPVVRRAGCTTRACFNPAHLQVVADLAAASRHSAGLGRRAKGRLPPATVEKIREMLAFGTYSRAEIAEQCSKDSRVRVSPRMVGDVARGRTYAAEDALAR